MKDPWQSYLKLGIVHSMAYPECLGGDGPIFETLREICYDPFFDAVDVGPINDPAQRSECAVLLRDCRPETTFACQSLQLRPGLDLNSADRAERHKTVDTILAHLDQARELGASRLAIMSGRNVAPAQRAGALDCLIHEVCRICKAARERAGLPVVLEIFDHDIDKKALIGTCAAAATLARAVRRDFPDFGLLHDLSHIYLCHEDPARDFPCLREHLVHVHMGSCVLTRDHPLYGDTHPLFGMEGGRCDVPELHDFLRVLFDVGYLRPGRRPICGFEIRPPTGVAPQTAIANIKRTWQHAWWTL